MLKMLTRHPYFDTVDMAAGYPNILTPPMDSPDFVMLSPKSETPRSPPLPYNNPILLHDLSLNGDGPCLDILEQPVEKFRFRYKSEMAGTHGSLNGRNSDRSRKQTFPSVRLVHYNSPATIRCSLYQIGRAQPHAHRLVKRVGSEEANDPHDIEVGPDVGFTANFINMGIIHTAKKQIVDELSRKYRRLKEEESCRTEGVTRKLDSSEEDEVRSKAETECNHINLNQVCLRFEAFKKVGNAMWPITQPMYSGTINNLKSAWTGDLKIVRMDHCTSSSKGGREIFILVEKVTKKNVKIRFFELDEEDNEIWNDYGRFNDLDVHHQYAIVFKTPPYRIHDIDKQVKVYIELQRPSDGARSEPKDFTYTPCEIIQGRKRARNSSTYSSGSSFSSKELPLILPNMEFTVNSRELEEALRNNNVDSTEFSRVCEQLIGMGGQELFSHDNQRYAMDAHSRSSKENLQVLPREEVIMNTVETEVKNFVHGVKNYTLPQGQERLRAVIENIFEHSRYKMRNNNNVLHLLAANTERKEFLLTFSRLLRTLELSAFVNTYNSLGQTPIHLAVVARNRRAIECLLEARADLSIQDLQGNTPLHFAIMREVPEVMVYLFFDYKSSHTFINLKNNEGNTALHLAVKTNNLSFTKLLCSNKANINLASDTNGYTPLHMAVADQHTDIINFLLECGCDTSLEDYSGSNALKLASVLMEPDRPTTCEIYNTLEVHMKKMGIFIEVLTKEEDNNSSDMEIDVKCEPLVRPNEDLIARYHKLSHLPVDCAKKLAKLMNASGVWKNLAETMNFGHLIRRNTFDDGPNPTGSFLDFVLASGEPLLRIRTGLNTLGEVEAVNILDSAVKEEPVGDE